MILVPRQAAILGATGPTGWHLARELARSGVTVRVVARGEARLREAFPEGFEHMSADLRDAAQTRCAIAGCDLAFDCIGFPLPRISDHAVAARALATASRESGCRVMQISSFWAYLPPRRLPINENHPRQGGPLPVRARREAEDILQDAGAAVLHLPDFFGPRVHVSSLQQALREAAQHKTVRWIGGRDDRRDYAFVPDAMKIAARLALREEAYGERWMVPGCGPISIREVLAVAERHLGRPIRLQAVGPMMLRFIAPFVTDLRLFLPMVPFYAQPIEYDAAKLRRLIGELSVTPYDSSLPTTLDWLRAAAPR